MLVKEFDLDRIELCGILFAANLFKIYDFRADQNGKRMFASFGAGNLRRDWLALERERNFTLGRRSRARVRNFKRSFALFSDYGTIS